MKPALFTGPFKKAGLLSFLFITLSGCNGLPKPTLETSSYVGESMVLSGLPAPGFFMASSIQWNEEYAVTAKHTPLIKNVVHECSTGCDLIFIKKTPVNGIPQWRQAVVGEPITVVGRSMAVLPVVSQGHVKDSRIQVTNQPDGVLVSTHDAPVAMGMSGGPMYGEDGHVLGMTLGIAFGSRATWLDLENPHSAGHGKRVSYYLPYNTILSEWALYEQNKAKSLTE